MVNVVASDRTEGAGDENVLPSPPPLVLTPPPTVAMVPAFEYAASESAVSPFVEIVGAADLAPAVGTWFSYPEYVRDGSLWEWDRHRLWSSLIWDEEARSLVYCCAR